MFNLVILFLLLSKKDIPYLFEYGLGAHSRLGTRLLNLHHFQPHNFIKMFFHQQNKGENTALSSYRVMGEWGGGSGGGGGGGEVERLFDPG